MNLSTSVCICVKSPKVQTGLDLCICQSSLPFFQIVLPGIVQRLESLLQSGLSVLDPTPVKSTPDVCLHQ